MCDTLAPFLETLYSLSQLALGTIWVTRAAGLRQMWPRAAGRDQRNSPSLQRLTLELCAGPTIPACLFEREGHPVWVLESSLRLSILAENTPSFSKLQHLCCVSGTLQSPSQVGRRLVNAADHVASHDLGHETSVWALPLMSAVSGSLELRMRCRSLLPHSQTSRRPPHRDTEAV